MTTTRSSAHAICCSLPFILPHWLALLSFPNSKRASSTPMEPFWSMMVLMARLISSKPKTASLDFELKEDGLYSLSHVRRHRRRSVASLWWACCRYVMGVRSSWTGGRLGLTGSQASAISCCSRTFLTGLLWISAIAATRVPCPSEEVDSCVRARQDRDEPCRVGWLVVCCFFV